MNYEVFDPFLRMDTWHTNSDYDAERFYRCLAQVVEDPDFSPDTMGKYMRKAKKIADGDYDHHFAGTIQDLVVKAWAVRDFLKMTKNTNLF